jgi:hypothetical protein
MNKAFVMRALALQSSLARTAPKSLFAFFCIDLSSAIFLRSLELKNVLVVAPDEFETPQLRAIKRKATLSEYCWTCKPVALLHAFATVPGLDWAIWVDSDMFAFSNPDKALDAYPEADVVLTPHRFSLPEMRTFEPVVGRFNAGYAAFRNTKRGHIALNWWRDRCFESCPAVPTDNKYADQKYLEGVVGLFDSVAQSNMAGLNCAPWNVFGLPVERNDAGVSVSKAPLLLYHFQGLKVIRCWLFDLYASSQFMLPKTTISLIYEPYLSALRYQMSLMSERGNDDFAGINGEFAGANGLVLAMKQLTWSKNMKVRF